MSAPGHAFRRPLPAPPRVARALAAMLAVTALATGLAGCRSDEKATPTSTSPSPTGSPLPSGWVRASTPTVTAEFPVGWERINDPNLNDGLAARSLADAEGARAVVSVRILDVGVGDAQKVGGSPATAAADQTLSQLQESGVKGATIVAGQVADRPGWVLRWTQVNKRDPRKRVFTYLWGVADVGTRQFVLVSAQGTNAQFAGTEVTRVVESVRLPLAVSPTSTPTRTPDGSGDVVVGKGDPTPSS